MEHNCKTLESLADYINSKEEWPLDVDAIIDENGWSRDGLDNDYDVCSDGTHLLTIGDDAKAYVTEL